MEKLNLHFLLRGSPKLTGMVRVLKLVVIFFGISVGSIFAKASAQGMKLDLVVQNKSLVEVMDLLKQKSGCSFIYSAVDVEKVKNLSLRAENMTLSEILDRILEGTGLIYSIEDKIVILKRAVLQQQVKVRTVSGVVLGQAKDTLAGVTVMVKGTSKGVITDKHGKYTLVLPEGDDVVIRFTFVGKKMVEVKYTGQKTINVTMQDDTQEIEEVIITGYQTIDKRHLTAAVTSIKAEDIMRPGASTIDKMLEGKVPGMIFMQNSGQVGAAPRLRVRGTSTVLGTQEPLWVLDGIILQDPVNVDPNKINDLDFVNLLGNAISGLNPQDIEQIDVLKDAAATALYGSRAANGVIVITTKQGKVGPPTISYSFAGTFSTRPRYSDRAIRMMNSRERVDYSREIIEKQQQYPDKQGWVGYEAVVEDYYNGKINFTEFQRLVGYYESLNTDWFDEICRDVFSHNHTLSFSGGSPNAKYYASLGYNRENGVLQKEFGDRYTANVKVSLKHKNFDAQFGLSGSVRKEEHTPSEIGLLNYAYNTSRAVPVYDENGELYYYPKVIESSGQSVEPWFNVLNERDNSYNKIKNNSLTLSTSLNYDFIESLGLRATFSYTISDSEDETYYGEKTAYAAALGTRGYNIEKGMDGRSLLPFGGELRKDNTKNENYTLRLQLNYHKYLDELQEHFVSFNGGWEITSSKYTGQKKTYRCYLPDRGLRVSAVDPNLYPSYAEWLASNDEALGILKDNLTNMASGYGSAMYSYKDLYILNVNMRVDFSNKFGNRANDKVLPIWSVSARWNAKEDILENANWINSLALRGSFGYQGNMLSSQSPELVIEKGGMNSAFNEYESTVNKYPNPDLGWEKTASFNTGLDFSLFRNKLRGTVSYFYKKTKNAFLSKKVAQVNGVTSYVVNAGTVENQGLELSLFITPVNTSLSGEGKGFRWSIDPQLGQVINKLVNDVIKRDKFDPLHDEYKYTDYLSGTAQVAGKPLNSFYSYEFTGLSPEDGSPRFARTGEENFEQYVDMAKSKVYTTVMKYSGCRVPYLQGSVSNTLAYNRLIFSFDLDYSFGSKVRLLKLYEDPTSSTIAPRSTENARKEMTKRWKKPGDEEYTNIPGLLSHEAYKKTLSPWWKGESYAFAENIWEMYNYSDIRVVSGNYLKLSRISLRYSFSEDLCKKMHLSSCYVALSGSNLFTWSAKELKGQDPASQSGSSDNINLSVRPTYSVSLNVSF
jgi:tonB-linked outer membrane protein, susC/ragA family